MMTPKTLYPSRIKTVGFLLLTSLFTATGAFMIRDGEMLMGLFVAIFFGFGVLVFAIMLLPNASYLQLSAEGFEVCSLFRKHFTSWDDVAEFGTVRQGANTFVAYNMRPDYAEQHKLRGFTRAIGGGFECRIPDTYGMKAMELAELMHNTKWQQHST